MIPPLSGVWTAIQNNLHFAFSPNNDCENRNKRTEAIQNNDLPIGGCKWTEIYDSKDKSTYGLDNDDSSNNYSNDKSIGNYDNDKKYLKLW